MPNNRGLVKWITTHPCNARQAITQRLNVYIFYVFHSLTTFLYTVTPRTSLVLTEQRQKLRKKCHQSGKRNVHVCRACHLLLLSTKGEKFCGWRKSRVIGRPWCISPGVKNFPAHRGTIDFTIELGHLWEWRRAVTGPVPGAYSTLCVGWWRRRHCYKWLTAQPSQGQRKAHVVTWQCPHDKKSCFKIVYPCDPAKIGICIEKNDLEVQMLIRMIIPG